MGIDRRKMQRNSRKKEWHPDDIIGCEDDDPPCESFDYEEIIHVTADGARLRVDGEAIWMPKSHIVDADESTVTITEWLVGKLGW